MKRQTANDAQKRLSAPDEETRARAAGLVERLGEKEAARRLGIGDSTLARLVAGFRLAPGTMALIRESFAREGSQ